MSNARLGMLIFLGAEAMFFGGLIGAFLVFRLGSPAWPPPGQPYLPVGVTSVNTAILLLSAYTMRQALRAIRVGNREGLRRGLLLTALLGLILLTLTLAQLSDLRQLRQRLDERLAIYQAVGEWLRENTDRGASVGLLETGIIGYYAGNRMIDFAGLLQPDVAEILPGQPDYQAAARYALERYSPDFAVLDRGSFQNIEREWLATRCRVVQEFPGAAYGYPRDLVIFDCRPAN